MIAINKPHGLLVHRTPMAKDVTTFALQLLRDQIGEKVYPAHRLDRKTSGVLLFAKSKRVNSQVQQLFRERKVQKGYTALVRGFLPGSGKIDYPLKEGIKVREAFTLYQLIQKFEIPLPSGKFSTSRYSLIELTPVTGRQHQLRRHLAHIFHPIIGDRPHGCNKQNKLWKEQFDMTTMMLHATALQFNFPASHPIHITAPWSKEFQRVLEILNGSNMVQPDVP